MDEGLRKNLQKVATKLFLKYGLRSISIDDICNEVHISKKTFYAHFSTKEELIESVLIEHNEKQLKKWECNLKPGIDNRNAIDNILLKSYLGKSNKNNHFVNFFYDLNKYYPEIQKHLILINHEKACYEIKQNIQQGINEGIFRQDFDIDLMSKFLALQFLTMINATSKEVSKENLQQGFDLIADINVRVLCNRKGMEYYENVIADKSQEKPAEDIPMKDEDLDEMVDRFFSTTDEIIYSVKPLTGKKEK